jgi:phage terminase Nu1 subunit (DNA packaging protein)
MTKIDDLTVSAAELAKVLGCGPRTLYSWAEEGLVVRRDRGFALAASVQKFVKHLQAARRDDRPARPEETNRRFSPPRAGRSLNRT